MVGGAGGGGMSCPCPECVLRDLTAAPTYEVLKVSMGSNHGDALGAYSVFECLDPYSGSGAGSGLCCCSV